MPGVPVFRSRTGSLDRAPAPLQRAGPASLSALRGDDRVADHQRGRVTGGHVDVSAWVRVPSAVRVMNHATIGSAPGPEHASDVDFVLGHLQAAAVGLQQLSRQLTGFLAGLDAAGRHGDDGGADPRVRVARVAFEMGAALQVASQLEGALARARQEISHMTTKDTNGQE